MIFNIPGREKIEISHVMFDFNGTIAIDGKLIEGVGERMDAFSNDLDFHVITADTFGSVEKELSGRNCNILKIPEADQDKSKLAYLEKLGKSRTLTVGNGRNDILMLREAAIGIAVIQEEGAFVQAVMAADIMVTSVLDVFAYFKTPDRLRATLRN